MVCGGLAVILTAHGHTDVLSSQILVVVCGGLRWCVVVCGGLWWFAVVCGGLWWIAVVCLLVIPVLQTQYFKITSYMMIMIMMVMTHGRDVTESRLARRRFSHSYCDRFYASVTGGLSFPRL